MKEIASTDSGADNMNCIQEKLIPLKYYEISSERLTQIFNYKLPSDHICFENIFKDLSSKVMLRNPFMALLYPLLMTDEGIKINILVFRFTSTLIPKEIYSLNNVTILKDINKVRIYSTERSLSSLKTKISLDDQLINNDIKKSKQNIETEICSYSPIAFCIGTDI